MSAEHEKDFNAGTPLQNKAALEDLMAKTGLGCFLAVFIGYFFLKEIVFGLAGIYFLFLAFILLSMPVGMYKSYGPPGAIFGSAVWLMLIYGGIQEYYRPIEDRADAYITDSGDCVHRKYDCPSIAGHNIRLLYLNEKCEKYSLDKNVYSLDIVKKKKLRPCYVCN